MRLSRVPAKREQLHNSAILNPVGRLPMRQ